MKTASIPACQAGTYRSPRWLRKLCVIKAAWFITYINQESGFFKLGPRAGS